MHFRLFHNTFIADLSGKWKLSRVLTPFVTGPEDRKSFRVIGTVFNVLYCLSIIIVCYLAYLNKGKTGLVIAFFILAVCGAICQTISIRIKKKAGRPSSSVKSLEACFKNRVNTTYTFAVGCSCRQGAHPTLSFTQTQMYMEQKLAQG